MGADYKGQSKKIIQEAKDSIYNMYEDAALKGYLGTGPKVAAEERRYQWGDRVKKKQRQGYGEGS